MQIKKTVIWTANFRENWNVSQTVIYSVGDFIYVGMYAGTHTYILIWVQYMDVVISIILDG